MTRKLGGDVKSAILLSYLIDLPIPRLALLKDVVNETGLSVYDIDKSRTVLKAIGLVSSRKTKQGLKFEVNQSALSLLPENSENSISQLQLNSIVIINKREIEISGKFDSANLSSENKNEELIQSILDGELDSDEAWKPRAHDIADALLREWCLVWGKKRSRVTASRVKVMREAIKESSLSLFAKAIYGMKWDQWEDRYKYCEWHHIKRNVSRFAELYEQHGKPSDTQAQSSGVKTKVVTTNCGTKTFVPTDYEWNETDSFMADNNYTFDIEQRKWK